MSLVVVRCSGSVLVSLNADILFRARLVLGGVTICTTLVYDMFIHGVHSLHHGVYAIKCRALQSYAACIPSNLCQLSLAITRWAGQISTNDGHDQCWGRNGDCCIKCSAQLQ